MIEPMPVVVAQWVALAGLAVLVVLMYRQLAYVIGVTSRVEQVGGLATGILAPSFNYHLFKEPDSLRHFVLGSQATLLLFADPGCAACLSAVRALEALMESKNDQISGALVVTDSQPELIESVDVFRSTNLDIAIVDAVVARNDYRTVVTPYLYVVGPSGSILSAGAADSTVEMRRLLEAAEHQMRSNSSIRKHAGDLELSYGGEQK